MASVWKSLLGMGRMSDEVFANERDAILQRMPIPRLLRCWMKRASALNRTLCGGLDQNRLSSLLVQMRNAGSVVLQAISFETAELRHSIDE